MRRLGALLFAAVLLAASHSAAATNDLRLLGTVVSSEAARSLAVIEQGGRQRVVRAGGELAGATVVEIRSEAVILERRGQLETLRIAGVTRAATAVTAVSTYEAEGNDARLGRGASPNARSPFPGARAKSPKGVVRRPAVNRPAHLRDGRETEAEAAESNDEIMATLASQARFAPVMDNDGKLRGVVVMNVMSDSWIERLGLRSDDVILSINGVAIDSSGKAMDEARGLNPRRPVRLVIERGGVQKPMTIKIQ